jgi:glucose-1-phosphate thymidylyltransferase
MEAVILAGGFATRLHPLTLHKAKPLLDVAGHSCLDRILGRLRPLAAQGLRRVVIVTNSKFVDAFEAALRLIDLPFEAVVVDNGVNAEGTKRGAVGDMAFGAAHLDGDGDFWVLAGDNLFEFDLALVWRSYAARGRRPLVLLSEVATTAEAAKYNNLELGADGEILRFIEKPRSPWSRLFAVCIYTFPPSVRDALGDYLRAGENPDNAGSFIAWLAGRTPVLTEHPAGAWFDIGSIEELEDARAFFAGRAP